MTRHRIPRFIRVRVPHQRVISEVEICLALLNSVSYVKVNDVIGSVFELNLPHISVSVKHSFERLTASFDFNLLRVAGSRCLFELSLSMLTVWWLLHLFSW